MDNKRTRFLLFFIFFCLCNCIVLSSSEAGQPLLYLDRPASGVTPGEKVTVVIGVRDMIPVYGMEVELAFDPKLLKVIDIEPESKGVQIEQGNFFDLSQKSFPLQNDADNSEGVIRYALSLLNPTPSAQGDGVLARISFLAKAPGKSFINVSRVKFGTREGKVVVPEVKGNNWIEVKSGQYKAPMSVMIIITAILIVILSAFYFLRRMIVIKIRNKDVLI